MTSKSRNSSIQDMNSDLPNQSISEVRVSIEQLRALSQSMTHRSFSNIADSLLSRHRKSQSKISNQRIRRKSLDFEDYTFVPKIIRKKYKVSAPKNTRKVQAIYDNIVKQKENKQQEISKLLKPRDVIEKPDLKNAKELFNSRSQKNKQENKENPFKLNLIKKTKFFKEKRDLEIQNSDREKIRVTMVQCTFKPDLSKRSRREFTSVANMSTISKSGQAKATLSRQTSMSRTSSYSKISPDEQNVSFREGSDVKRILNKSKPLIRYNLVPKT